MLMVGVTGLPLAGCASDTTASEAELDAQDALMGGNLDLKNLKAEKERKRADLKAKEAEEAANPTRRTPITKLWNEPGPRPDDAVQNMSDCYFAAAVAAVAHAQPGFFKTTMLPKYEVVDGVQTTKIAGYGVTLFDTSDDLYGAIPEVIDIENTLPLAANGKLLFGYGGNGTFWFPVIERAFARQKGGYDKIGSYGMAGAALSRVTGQFSKAALLTKGRKDAAWRRVSDALNNHQPLVACNVLKDPLPGMTSFHCNALVGSEEKDGERWVKMYNSRQKLYLPTKTKRAAENTVNGYYWVSIAEWVDAFDYIVYTTGLRTP